MDVTFLLDRYFKDVKNVSIDVFDAQTLNAVYRDVEMFVETGELETLW